jgi:hypothetical protein
MIRQRPSRVARAKFIERAIQRSGSGTVDQVNNEIGETGEN